MANVAQPLAAVASVSNSRPANGIAASPEVTRSAYLPIVFARFPPQNIFGVGAVTFNTAGSFQMLTPLGGAWSRHPGVAWSQVEPTEGNRNWSVLAGFEQELINASAAGISPIIIIWSTPTWAQSISGSFCGPVAPAKYAAFASYVSELVKRYSGSPYNVKYWEIGNEPDVQASVSNGGFGCWGNNTDAYYGGGAYGNALKAVYPAVKAANPTAQVLMGGLLMDSPNDACPTNDCPARFFEGMLRAGGGLAFDGVSFHAYDAFGVTGTPPTTPNVYGSIGGKWGTAWNTTGPVITAKLNFLKQRLAKYGVTGKYFLNTETALICGYSASDCTTGTFETAKAYYVPISYAYAIREGLRANIWYDLQSGWKFSNLIGGGAEFPAYSAMKLARTKLQDAVYVRDFAPTPGVKAFEFTRGNKRLWVVWSFDGAAHNVTLSPTPTSIQDALGAVTPNAASVQVTSKPLYIEWDL
ncbi:MAG: hypothetical protein HC853_16280 [Anaerolineae bacterium]|nr:hypothetical protein [Anaerolineae bacterium]